jgi:hypothetical protein
MFSFFVPFCCIWIRHNDLDGTSIANTNECAGNPDRLETVSEVREVAQPHAALDPSESAAAIGFLDLAIQQIERHLPTEFQVPSVTHWPK